MHRRGGPNVAIAFGPGGSLTAQLRAVESPGGPVSGGGGDHRKRDSARVFTANVRNSDSAFVRKRLDQTGKCFSSGDSGQTKPLR